MLLPLLLHLPPLLLLLSNLQKLIRGHHDPERVQKPHALRNGAFFMPQATWGRGLMAYFSSSANTRRMLFALAEVSATPLALSTETLETSP